LVLDWVDGTKSAPVNGGDIVIGLRSNVVFGSNVATGKKNSIPVKVSIS